MTDFLIICFMTTALVKDQRVQFKTGNFVKTHLCEIKHLLWQDFNS